MSGISLVTKGFIAPITETVIPPVVTTTVGGGSPPVHAQEHLPKPFIKIEKVNIDGSNNISINEDTFRVKNVKIIVDEKD